MTATTAAATPQEATSDGTITPETPPPFSRLPIGHGAVLRAIKQNTIRVALPVLGEIRLPPGDTLAWLGGLATLAALGIIDWPVTVAVGVGHLLAHQQRLRLLKDFGEGLEEV
ncbi:MAG TPA: hypothetical protein VFP72_15250 [Kineosporiaceae bacterium]|nr:hypothetical protein [Kineosporiaceae bacterium]